MSLHVDVNFGTRPHHHHHHGHHRHHHHRWGGFRFPKLPFFRPRVDIPVTPLSETGRKFVNIGAASLITGLTLSIIGAALFPVSFGATGALCGVGGGLIVTGLGAMIYGHIHG